MKKLLLSLMILSSPCYAGLITHTDYTSGATITASGQNTNENTIVNEFNGNIDNDNIKSGAAIAVNKLAAVTANSIVTSDGSGFITASSATLRGGTTIQGTINAQGDMIFAIGYGVRGSTQADNAGTGVVGEYISSSTVTTIPAASSTHYKNMVAITLTPGDWDVTLIMSWDSSTGITNDFYTGISSTTGDSSAGLVSGQSLVAMGFAANTLDAPSAYGNTNAATILTIPNMRYSTSASVTLYAKMRADYGSGTPQAFGILSARRAR